LALLLRGVVPLKPAVLLKLVGVQVTVPVPPLTFQARLVVSPGLAASVWLVPFVAVTGAILVVVVSVPVSATVMGTDNGGGVTVIEMLAVAESP